MRSIDPNLTGALTNSRKITGRLTFRDARLIFASRAIVENIVLDSTAQMDTSTYGTGFLQCAKTNGDVLAWRYVSDPTLADWGVWTVEAIALEPTCAPGCEAGRIWYMTPAGDLYYADFNGAALGAPVLVQAGLQAAEGLPSATFALAPVSTDLCYIQSGPAAAPLVHTALLAYTDTGVLASQFHGYIYGDPANQYRFDAVRANGSDYVFVADRDDGRTLVIRVQGEVWSDIEPLVPMDVVDNDNSFKFSGASKMTIGGVDVIFSCGRYKRGTFAEFDIYTRGSDHWTMGRDVFILTNNIAGKMFLVSDTVYYVGFGMIAEADATILVGYDAAAKKLQTSEAHTVNASFRQNAPSVLGVALSSTVASSVIRRNARVTVEGSVAGYYGTLGIFAIDNIEPSRSGKGQDRQISGRGLGYKQLDQWVSDQSYDYWSQTKVSANPSTLTDFVRTTGQWTNESDLLKLDQLNVDGWMYCAHAAARNSAMRARFQFQDESYYEPTFGVAVNYYKETRAEAAIRLDEDKEEVLESEYGHNGIVALWRNDVISLFRVKNSQDMAEDDPTTWTLIDSAALVLAPDVYHWLELVFQDGYLRVMYRLGSSTTWSVALAAVYAEDSQPWFRPNNDDAGRGAFFVRNITPFSYTPGFDSQAMLIPVESVAPFPASGNVIVDSERIDYSGKFTAAIIPPELSVTTGNTFVESPVLNNLWIDLVLRAQEWNVDAAGEANIGKDHTSELVYLSQFWSLWYKGQRMPGYNIGEHYGDMRVDYARVPVKKIGTPTNDLYAYMVWDNWDNQGIPDQASFRMASAPITAAGVGAAFDWITFDFTGNPEATRWLQNTNPGPGKAPKYWWKAWLLVITTMPPADFAYGAYFDPVNYYVAKMNNNKDDQIGIVRYWDVQHRWRFWNQGHVDSIMPMEIMGKHAIPWEGYEIYIDTADVNVLGPLYYTDMALVVTDGAGKGNVYKIVYYDYWAPQQWVPSQTYEEPDKWQDHVDDPAHGAWVDQNKRRVFVDRKVYSLDETSKVRIMPALKVVTRGTNDTEATSHGNTKVNLYAASRVQTNLAEYHTAQIDLRIEDMTAELVAKSGTLLFSAEKDLNQTCVFAGAGWNDPLAYDQHRDAIVKFTMPALDAGEEAGTAFRLDTDVGYAEGYALTIDSGDILKFYKYDVGWILIESWPLPIAPTGSEVTMSCWTNHFGVWLNGRFMHTFTDATYSSPTSVNGDYAGPIAKGVVSFDVDLSACDRRVDNFILDMGQHGTGLLRGLIGNKRLTVLDTPAGGLRMARTKFATGVVDYTVPDLIIQESEKFFDPEITTFVRAEGLNVIEVADYAQIATDGYLFGLYNASEANDDWETKQEADALLLDSDSSAHAVSGAAGADPRVEPNDVIGVTLPAELGLGAIVVDDVSFALAVRFDSATFDMMMNGRDPMVSFPPTIASINPTSGPDGGGS